ncbi:MAG: hypothetical protein Q7T68_13340 [Sphingopyxis sp.]|nr:hypothetical protein [Sphingopyxis sp.]
MRLAFLIPPMILLAACGSEEKAKESTEVSINAGDEHGGVQIKTGKDGGNIKIGGGGAAIDIDIPDFVDLNIEDDFDIDGVKLYPGSKVTKVDVDANDKNGADKAVVKLGFTSPAAPTKAADWMAGEFAKQGVKVTRTGDTLAGKDKDGADFRINFAPDGATAKGEVAIVKS